MAKRGACPSVWSPGSHARARSPRTLSLFIDWRIINRRRPKNFQAPRDDPRCTCKDQRTQHARLTPSPHPRPPPQAELHAGVIKYQSEQRFQEKMYELTKRQKERFAALGVRTAM